MTGMPRPLNDRAAIEAEIDRVRSLDVDSLRTLWRTTFRSSPPPAFSKDILARFLCWHIQEQAFGGLDPKTAKHLDGLARGDRSRADRSRRMTRFDLILFALSLVTTGLPLGITYTMLLTRSIST